jgi:hypothetical protein
MQFHRCDMGAGMVLVYRRPDSPFTDARFQLRGLAGRACRLEPFVGGNVHLAKDVLDVTLPVAPAVTVVFYEPASL